MIRKIELLSPAKNLECGKAAIDYGADAVYIGAPKFGARSAASNSVDTIRQLCDYAHVYQVKVYVAFNTILYNKELSEAQELISELYDAGVDALIIQDLGLLEYNTFPLPLIASTQTNNYELERIKFIEKAGFKRVILARELSLEQIKEIRTNTSIELEFFIHGALCVSFSGQCYISQAIAGRSANRGECAQICRLSFSLEDKTGKVLQKDLHLLSLKDLNLSSHLLELIDAGIDSFKIEGRLKDIDYVKNTTASYRKLLDVIINDRNDLCRSSIGKSYIKFTPDVTKTFNRGFTDYFIEGRKENISSIQTPKSLGKKLGIVKYKTTNYIEIDTTEKIVPGDGLCYITPEGNLDGFLVNKAEGNKIFLSKENYINKATIIYRNHDHQFIKEVLADKSERKIDVWLHFTETIHGFCLRAIDETELTVIKEITYKKEIAKQPEKVKDNIINQLEKTGGTIFNVVQTDVEISKPYFFQASFLNELRREVFDLLKIQRLQIYKRDEIENMNIPSPYIKNDITYLENVSNKEAIRFYKNRGVNKIEDAFELQKDFKGKTIMKTKHCLRFSNGMCPEFNNKNDKNINYPLYLVDQKRRYRLEFDCRECVMKIIYE